MNFASEATVNFAFNYMHKLETLSLVRRCETVVQLQVDDTLHN